MANKVIEIAGIGAVALVKRKGSRSIRLSVAGGKVRVSLPAWTPYAAGEAFARSHSQWILSELAKQHTSTIEAGQRIGKLHYMRFEQVLGAQPVTARVTGTEIIVRLHSGEQTTDPAVQERAYTACVRALK